jgi:hypothetical protein
MRPNGGYHDPLELVVKGGPWCRYQIPAPAGPTGSIGGCGMPNFARERFAEPTVDGNYKQSSDKIWFLFEQLDRAIQDAKIAIVEQLSKAEHCLPVGADIHFRHLVVTFQKLCFWLDPGA